LRKVYRLAGTFPDAKGKARPKEKPQENNLSSKSRQRDAWLLLSEGGNKKDQARKKKPDGRRAVVSGRPETKSKNIGSQLKIRHEGRATHRNQQGREKGATCERAKNLSRQGVWNRGQEKKRYEKSRTAKQALAKILYKNYPSKGRGAAGKGIVPVDVDTNHQGTNSRKTR